MSSPEEVQFLSQYEPTDFERPSVAVDVVLLTQVDGEMRVLVVRRSEHPHRDTWTLPGTFVRPDESLVVQMTNIAPWGEEGRAVRFTLTRA